MDANIQARQVTTPGQVIIAVVTPPPGGGTSNAMTLNISSPEPLAITTSMLPTTGHGKSFRFVLFATGGVLHPYYPQESYTWSVDSGQLPAGLSLHIYNGSISGTVQGSTSSFTVGVSDFSTSPTHVSRDLTIEVHPPRWP